MNDVCITFAEDGTTTHLRSGSDLHSLFQISFGCRKGLCGVCAIRIVNGKENVSRQGHQERETIALKGLKGELRLACQCAINGNVTICRIEQPKNQT